MARIVRLATMLLTIVACHPRPAEAPSGEACGPGEGPVPALEPPRAVPAPDSQVTVTASVTTQRLQRELAAEIPEVIASGEEHVGAPGRLSYVVRRGPLSPSLSGDDLLITTTVSVSAQICKPFGPLCVVYGRCNPTLVARAGLPLVLGADYALGKSKVTVAVAQGCTVAGFDATSEVRRAGGEAAAETKRRIDRELPDLRPEIAARWGELHRTVALDDRDCLRIVPLTVTQTHPKLAEEVLTSGATVTGRLSLERPCTTSEATVPPLPPLATSDELGPGIRLEILVVVPWSEVGAAFDRAVGGGEDHTPRSVEVRGARVDGESRVVLGVVSARARCGTRSWAMAEPWFDAAAREIRLREIAPVPGIERKQRPSRALSSELETVAVPLPVDLVALEKELDHLIAALVPPLADGVVAEIEVGPPRVSQVTVVPEGIAASVLAKGTARIRAE
ncbi:MAG: DUF4403 family protein [Polyangiaceae bacterium]|nr:DUF4403 family protein [Polyangiaceae bacterium]